MTADIGLKLHIAIFKTWMLFRNAAEVLLRICKTLGLREQRATPNEGTTNRLKSRGLINPPSETPKM